MTSGSGRRLFWGAGILVALLSLVFLLWVTVRFGGSRLTDGVDDLGELVAALTSAVACWLAGRRGVPSRLAWRFMALSSLAWGLGEAAWCYYDLVRDVVVPFPSMADAGYLMATPLAVIALASFLGPAYTNGLLARGFVVAFALGYAAAGAYVSLQEIAGHPHFGPSLSRLIGTAYPMGDLVLASMALLIIQTYSDDRISLGFVLAGILAFTVADSSFDYFTATNQYGIGNTMDTGWVAGYFLVALGALWAITRPSEDGLTALGTGREVAPPRAAALPLFRAGSEAVSALVPSRPSAMEQTARLELALLRSSASVKSAANRMFTVLAATLIAADAVISLYDFTLLGKTLG